MDIKTAKEYVRDSWEDILNIITKPAKTRVNHQTSYICPLCDHGKGGDGLTFIPESKDQNTLKCFGGCGFTGDIIALVGEVFEIDDFIEQLIKCCELLNFSLDDKDPPQETYNKPKKKTKQKNKKTYSAASNNLSKVHYFKECHERLNGTDYHIRRGITEKTAKRFMLGYDPRYRTYNPEKKTMETWQALIIPTGHYSYVARNINPEATAKNRYRKKGESTPINLKKLTESTQPIFITEGELDALSIIEAGGEAIGLGSTDNKDKFIEYVKKHKPAQPLILALDNDEPGKTATAGLAQSLNAQDISFYVEDPYNGLKDANTALLDDREYFISTVSIITEQVKKMESEKLEKEREEYQKKNSAYSHIQDFINGITESIDTPAQPTGFKKLDDTLDGGLYEGLYFLGAIPSLGKTTLALQIADQIAQTGKDVLIFSLEMSRSELMSKSISRQTILDVLANNGNTRDAKTARGITAGARYENYSQTEINIIKRAIKAYEGYARHIYIHEGIGDIGVTQIRETVEQHEKITGQAPIVLVDYMQILAPNDVRATDKQNTDKAVLELKRLSRDFKTPVIGISSFNRTSYKEKVMMEAYKESGAIEYGSDVLIGLQFEGAGKENFDSTEKKKEDPRKIELIILKNRNGKTGDKIKFKYYPLFNYFMEC